MVENVPNPGSDAAIAAGCKCPILDNGHGRGYMGVSGMFVIAEGCPIHPMPKDDDEEAPADSADMDGG